MYDIYRLSNGCGRYLLHSKIGHIDDDFYYGCKTKKGCARREVDDLIIPHGKSPIRELKKRGFKVHVKAMCLGRYAEIYTREDFEIQRRRAVRFLKEGRYTIYSDGENGEDRCIINSDRYIQTNRLFVLTTAFSKESPRIAFGYLPAVRKMFIFLNYTSHYSGENPFIKKKGNFIGRFYAEEDILSFDECQLKFNNEDLADLFS